MLTTEDNTQAEVTSEVTDEMLDDFFAQALARHEAEDWQAAENFYRKVLAVIPEQSNVNYNLGMLKLQLNQVNASLNFFKKALASDETQSKYWIAYVEALTQAGQKYEAVNVLTKGLEQGLHGEEIDALVNELTKVSPAQAAPKAPMPANYSHQAAVIPQSGQQQAINMGKPAAKQTKSTASKSIQPYLNHPQVNKVLALQQGGQLAEAKKQGNKLLKLLPKHPILLTCLGGIAVTEERFDEAVSLFKQSLEIASEQATALSYLSIVYLQQKKFKASMRCINEAIEVNPEYAEAHANKGNILKAQKRYEEALKCYEKSLALKPDVVDTQYNLGLLCADLKQYQQSANYFKQVVTSESRDAHSLHLYAEVLLNIDDYQESIKFFDASIALNGSGPSTWEGRGLVHLKLQQFDLARDDFMHVIKAEPKNANAYNNLGVALRELGQHEDALAAYDTAIALDKGDAKTLTNKGILLVDMHRYEDAFDCYEQGMRIGPDCYENHWNKAILHLLTGDYTQGWSLYESRWKSIFKEGLRSYSQPLWLGDESIAGKTLFIYPEQGFGDYIQFCRYVTDVEKLGATVVLEVKTPLLPLMQTFKGNVNLIEAGSSLPDFDYHCPIMSLPLAFKTQQETIPAHIPYLYADEKKAESWAKRLGDKTKPRVGLVWSGSTAHRHDRYRSVALETLSPIFASDFEFHALQNEMREHDVTALNEINNIETHEDDLNDFSDTAALIDQMDLVITVDTSVAHLAGAMGKECWVLLAHSPDFRWLTDRTDSPWYPTVTLFRQPEYKDWTSVINTLTERLQAMSGE